MKKEQKLVSRIAIALTAGLFSIVPAGHAMPQATGANADNNKAAAAITTANNTMDIAGNKESNVLKWDSFSVAGNETVQFDKGAQTKNYLNIVNGTNMSEIYGRINGGRNVYLINPNGILFGAGAQVNVGNLAASTRSLTGVNTDSFDGTNALKGTAGKAAGDIINMGRLQAASVMLEGNEVRICNTGDLTSDGTAKLTGAAVIVKAGGEVNIGYETAKTSTRKFSETETVQVQDYADTSENKVNAASSLGWTVTDLSGQKKSSCDSMLVNNVYDLQNMDQNLSGRYMLAGDIAASNTSSWDSGKGFSPVGNENNKFTGILDGGSHTINGLHINRSAADYVGLIGYNAGTIQNVGLTGGSIAGQKQVGGVAGYNGIDGIITNVYNTGAVDGLTDVGSMAGSNEGKVTNAYNTGTVSASNNDVTDVGGVVGANKGTVTHVHNTGMVSGYRGAGGVVGYNNGGGTIEDAYNTGAVNGNNNVGGVAGSNVGSTITNVYNTGMVSGSKDYVGGVVGSNRNDLFKKSTITNVYNTGAVSGNAHVGGVAGSNVDNKNYAESTIANAYNTGTVSGSKDYVGGVVGDNIGTITNVYNTGAVSGNDYAGGVAGYNNDGGTIKDAYNTGAVSGNNNVGGVAGSNAGSTITNAYNTGTVSGSKDCVGGVVGDNKGTITNVYNTGVVSGSKDYVGGVAGDNTGSSTIIKDAYNTGAVSGNDYVGGVVGYNGADNVVNNVYNTGAVSGNDYVGGVAGYNKAFAKESGTIDIVHNTGMVSGSDKVGGVVGDNEGPVTNAYNTGAVSGSNNVGGVVGYNGVYIIVENVYNTGAVSGASCVGGVVGNNDNINSKRIISQAYNTGTVSGSDNVGGVAGRNVGTIHNVYNTGMVSGSGYYVGGVAGNNASTDGIICYTYNTGAVNGSSDKVGGVVGYNNWGTVTNSWYATTDAANHEINRSMNDIGTGEALSVLQGMKLTDYGFDANYWRTNAADDSTKLVATTPMLKAFKSTALDAAIGHSKVQYGTAEAPLTNIYQTDGDVVLDMSSLSRDANVGAVIYGHNLTLKQFTAAAGDSSTWASNGGSGGGGQLTLQNSSGFTVNSSMKLIGTSSITLTIEDSKAGAIIDYGQNITPALNITANDIVLDTDRVNTAASGQTTVTLTAAGTAKAGYTPTGIMEAMVNNNKVNVPKYDSADKRAKYPKLSVGDGGAAISEGQWIKNVNELQAMGKEDTTLKQTYFLYGDIDASATSKWNTDAGFSPVGTTSTSSFTGTFDGLNHTITGLYINRSETDYVGLIGYASGNIQNVGMAGGRITGKNTVSGVVGYNGSNSTVTNAYNTGMVSGTNYVGGVVGENHGTVKNVYNTGAVGGTDYVGGVVAYNGSGVIENVYNTGAVSGKFSVGGVVGQNWNIVKNVYNTGDAHGASNVGGVVGYNGSNRTVTNAYDVSSLTDAEKYKASTYQGFDPDTTGGQDKVWRIYEGYTTPFLKSFLKTVTVSGSNQTVEYDGNSHSIARDSLSYGTKIESGKVFLGARRNAGSCTLANMIYSVQDGYDFASENTFTIHPKSITASIAAGSTFDKTYDGTTAVTADAMTAGKYSLNDAIANDAVSLDVTKLSGSYTDKNAADNKAVSFTGLALTGTDAQNYTLTTTELSGTGKITAKNITAGIAAGSTFDKTYDGTTAATADAMTAGKYSLNDAIAKDAVSLDVTKLSGSYTDKNAADNKAVSFTGLALTGTDAQNYTLTTTELSGMGNIAPKNITAGIAAGSTFDKTYDGTAAVTADAMTVGKYSLNDAIANDAVSLDVTKLSGSYTDKNAADNKAVSFKGLVLTGTDAQNYTLTTTELSGMGNIAPKLLDTIQLTGPIDKPQDGNDTAVLAGHYQLGADLAAGDEVSLSGSGHYEDALSGQHKLVTFRDLSLGGAEQSNYRLRAGLELTGYGSILASVQPVVPQPIQPVPPLPSEPDAAVQPVQPGQAGFQPGIPQMVAQNSWYHGLQLGSLRMEPMQMSFAQGRPPYFARIMNTGSLLTHKNLWLEISAGGIRLPEEAFAGSPKDIRFDLWDWLI